MRQYATPARLSLPAITPATSGFRLLSSRHLVHSSPLISSNFSLAIPLLLFCNSRLFCNFLFPATPNLQPHPLSNPPANLALPHCCYSCPPAIPPIRLFRQSRSSRSSCSRNSRSSRSRNSHSSRSRSSRSRSSHPRNSPFRISCFPNFL